MSFAEILTKFVIGEDNADEEFIALGSHKKTEVFRISPSVVPDGLALDMHFNNGVRSGYYSLAFLLQRILADKLDVDPMEIEIADIPVKTLPNDSDKKVAEIILTDELQNGSGFVRRLYEEFADGSRRQYPKEWENRYTNGHYKRGVE